MATGDCGWRVRFFTGEEMALQANGRYGKNLGLPRCARNGNGYARLALQMTDLFPFQLAGASNNAPADTQTTNESNESSQVTK